MTDKELKDWCKTCDVEPPAMRFKCPECEHNTDKEQIMINGVDVSECEYLTYELEEDGQYYWFCNIAPVGGPDECGYRPECFYKKIFKQLARKTQECKKLNNKIIDMNSIIEDAAINLGNKDFTLYDLPFEIKKLSQECENLKAEEKYLKQCCQKAGEELAKHSFEYDGKEKNLVVQAIELNEKYEKFKKALEEIAEPFCNACQEFEPEKKGSNCMYCNYGIILRKISEVEK